MCSVITEKYQTCVLTVLTEFADRDPCMKDPGLKFYVMTKQTRLIRDLLYGSF